MIAIASPVATQLQLMALLKPTGPPVGAARLFFHSFHLSLLSSGSPPAGSPTANSGATAATTSPPQPATGTSPLPAAGVATSPGSAATSTGDASYLLLCDSYTPD